MLVNLKCSYGFLKKILLTFKSKTLRNFLGAKIKIMNKDSLLNVAINTDNSQFTLSFMYVYDRFLCCVYV